MAEVDLVRHYRITHRARLAHDTAVSSSWGEALILPRRTAEQVVHRTRLDIRPLPRERRHLEDLSGNRVMYFHVTHPHTALEVTAHSLVTVDRPRVDVTALPHLAWDQVVALVRAVRTVGRPGDGTHPGPREVLHIASGSLPSELIPHSDRAQALALDTFAPGQSLASAVTVLNHRVFRAFEHHAGAATFSPLEQVLATGGGMCDDLAHVMIAALRSLGLAAMFVSGHLDPADSPGASQGATHAWVAVWMPGAGWVHVDPTHGRFVDERYVILGWGRDRRDVEPLRAVALSPGTGSAHAASLEMRALGPEELARALHTDERA